MCINDILFDESFAQYVWHFHDLSYICIQFTNDNFIIIILNSKALNSIIFQIIFFIHSFTNNKFQ